MYKVWRIMKTVSVYRRGRRLGTFIKLLAVTSLLAFVPLLRSARASSTSSLTVTSQDTSGSTITGYYTVLLDSTGSTLATGVTPVTFTLDYTVPTTSYTALSDDFNGVVFDHRVDTNHANTPSDVTMVRDPA